MLMMESEDRLHNIKQGERSVAEYVQELQCLWADLVTMILLSCHTRSVLSG
jgi:hypothetical protein